MFKRFRVGVLAVSMTACIQVGSTPGAEQFSAVDFCQSKAAEVGSRSATQIVEVQCDLTKPMWLVALPDRQVNAKALEDAGVPHDVALSLSQRDTLQQEFVAIQEVAPDRTGDPPDYRLTNAKTSVQIPKAFAARAQIVALGISYSNGLPAGTLVSMSAKP